MRDVAVLFELVVNFGDNEPAVQAAAAVVHLVNHVEVRGVLPYRGSRNLW